MAEKRISPQAARALERREAKLQEMAEQIEDGTLVVRKMTAAERKRFAARPGRSAPKGRTPR
jgi:hypothetical protein